MRAAVVFILINVFLDAMGIALIIPVMPDLLTEVQGGSLGNAALWGGILTTAFAIMQFLFGPMLGSLSDRYGRRPVLLVALVVSSLDYLVMAVAGSIWLLLAARMICGITAATQSTASAYMADISKPEDKAANFGLIGAAFGLGFVLGPLIGGLLSTFGTRAPFYAAAALMALNFLFGYIVLKETVTDRIRRPFTWQRANPVGAFASVSRLAGIGPLIFVYFIYSVAFNVYPSVWAFFTIERFKWDAATVGLSLGLFGLCMAIVQGGLIRWILHRLGERGSVIYGHIFDMGVFALIGFIRNGTAALIMAPVSALGAVITPALQGIMSKAVDDDAQGELQGLLSSANALAMIIAPLMMTSTFAYFSGPNAPVYLPGAPFLLAGVLMIGSLAVFLRARFSAT
jgi:DHA1 family tetracycline resistance protein-like MFS transporter